MHVTNQPTNPSPPPPPPPPLSGAEVIELTAEHRIGASPLELARLEGAGGRLARLNEYGAGPSRGVYDGVGPVRLWPGGIMVGGWVGGWVTAQQQRAKTGWRGARAPACLPVPAPPRTKTLHRSASHPCALPSPASPVPTPAAAAAGGPRHRRPRRRRAAAAAAAHAPGALGSNRWPLHCMWSKDVRRRRSSSSKTQPRALQRSAPVFRYRGSPALASTHHHPTASLPLCSSSCRQPARA